MIVNDGSGSGSGRGGSDNRMGTGGAISYIIGTIVGAGIFVTPTEILRQTNSIGLSLTIWLAAGGVALLGAFSYVELGTSIRESGGDFAYMRFVKWRPLAFAFMCISCMVILPATVAIFAQTFSEYLFSGLGIALASAEAENAENPSAAGINHPCAMQATAIFWARKLVEILVICALAHVNFHSLSHYVARFNIAAVAMKLLATGGVIAIGAYFLAFRHGYSHFVDTTQLFANSTHSGSHLVKALFAALFTYDGWDVLNYGIEEVADPRRTLPLAIIIGMTVVCCIFLSMNVAYFAVLDIPTFLSSQAVASTLISTSLGPYFRFLMPSAVCLIMLGSINTAMFIASRYLHAASRAGYLPTFLSCTNVETESPRAALALNALLSIGMLFVGGLDVLLPYTGFASWSQRVASMLALLWIRHRRLVPNNTQIIRGPLAVPLLFLGACLALLITTLVEEVMIAATTIAVLVLTLVLYAAFMSGGGIPTIPLLAKLATAIDAITTSTTQILLNSMPHHLMEKNNREEEEEEEAKGEGQRTRTAAGGGGGNEIEADVQLK